MPAKLLIQNNACLPAKVDIVFWRIKLLVSTNHYRGTTYLVHKSNAATLHIPRDYLHIARHRPLTKLLPSYVELKSSQSLMKRKS